MKWYNLRLYIYRKLLVIQASCINGIDAYDNLILNKIYWFSNRWNNNWRDKFTWLSTTIGCQQKIGMMQYFGSGIKCCYLRNKNKWIMSATCCTGLIECGYKNLIITIDLLLYRFLSFIGCENISKSIKFEIRLSVRFYIWIKIFT